MEERSVISALVAQERYHEACSLLAHPRLHQRGELSPESSEEVARLSVACELNCALCSLKLERWEGAIRSCDKVLAVQPDNVKVCSPALSHPPPLPSPPNLLLSESSPLPPGDSIFNPRFSMATDVHHRYPSSLPYLSIHPTLPSKITTPHPRYAFTPPSLAAFPPA